MLGVASCWGAPRSHNTKKRYAVIESSDVMRNISWLASCFSKIKKPNRHFSGNQSVIAGVCIYDFIFYLHRKVSIFLRNNSDCKDVDLYTIQERDTQ
jgi:hypothetical protein